MELLDFFCWNHVWNPHLGVQFAFWWIDNVFITTYSISRYVQSTKWVYTSLLESVGLRFQSSIVCQKSTFSEGIADLWGAQTMVNIYIH